MPHDLTPSADPGGAAETVTMREVNEYAAAYYGYVRSAEHPEADVKRLRDAVNDARSRLQDRLEEQANTIASLRARLAESDRIITSYRGMLAAKLGYTLIPEDTVIRPDGMSYVKPSEFDRMAAALTPPEPT